MSTLKTVSLSEFHTYEQNSCVIREFTYKKKKLTIVQSAFRAISSLRISHIQDKGQADHFQVK